MNSYTCTNAECFVEKSFIDMRVYFPKLSYLGKGDGSLFCSTGYHGRSYSSIFENGK